MIRKQVLVVPADWKRPCEMEGCRETSEYTIHSEQFPKNMGMYICGKCLNEIMRAAARINGLALVDPTKSEISEKAPIEEAAENNAADTSPPANEAPPNPYRVSDKLRKGARK